MYGSIRNCVLFQKTAKNPLLLPIVDQLVYSLTLSKILEGIVSRQIWENMEKNDTANQHAYRKKHSTTTALVDVTDQWLNAMDNGTFVGVLFFDFSAAFHLVDHERILTKLMH